MPMWIHDFYKIENSLAEPLTTDLYKWVLYIIIWLNLRYAGLVGVYDSILNAGTIIGLHTLNYIMLIHIHYSYPYVKCKCLTCMILFFPIEFNFCIVKTCVSYVVIITSAFINSWYFNNWLRLSKWEIVGFYGLTLVNN